MHYYLSEFVVTCSPKGL